MRGMARARTPFLKSGQAHRKSALGSSSLRGQCFTCGSSRALKWLFLLLCASPSHLPACLHNGRSWPPCSFVTTTFVVEAMAAANAQLRWKRMENHQVRVLPSAPGGASVRLCTKEAAWAARPFPPRARGTCVHSPARDPVPEQQRHSHLSLASPRGLCSLPFASWVPAAPAPEPAQPSDPRHPGTVLQLCTCHPRALRLLLSWSVGSVLIRPPPERRNEGSGFSLSRALP